MSGLEFLLVLALFAVVLWPSKKGKGVFSRAGGWLARRRTLATRIKAAEASRAAAAAPPQEPVKPAPVPAVRVGRARRAYVSTAGRA
ncbi:MAG: hypothetical protein HYZ11_07025 [Candidatus Tectomicrobia bacterium]|uniref:Uncharacterized protein n=1 Tax=Tectimicrobiota bacterium TaxID=2528274 RepID=A0A932HZU7_UNCTE|nr:hypothetical protein [Candidatus Tectomicrobia bacterium]